MMVQLFKKIGPRCPKRFTTVVAVTLDLPLFWELIKISLLNLTTITHYYFPGSTKRTELENLSLFVMMYLILIK